MTMSENASPPESDDHPPNRRGAMFALLAIVILVVLGFVVARTLHKTSRLQDCVMSGRSNCAPVEAPPR